MKDTDILEAVEISKKRFGPKCGKYSGALTVEIIRHALQKEGIRVSPRDVFLRGVPTEIDLVIPKRNISPRNRLVYEPSDILVAIEVKNSGSFGVATIQTVRKNSKLLKKANSGITYCYLTLAERKGFKWAVNDENAGCKTYTMFWHSGSGSKRLHESTGDWECFLKAIREIQKKA